MELSMEELIAEINKYLDEEGRIKQFPAKQRNKVLSLMYLSTKFEKCVTYTEKEVNEIIERNHTFQDKWLLRRELIDRGFLCRYPDGSKYWMPEQQPALKDFGL